MKKIKRPIKPPLGAVAIFVREDELSNEIRNITNKHYLSREKELFESLIRKITAHRKIDGKLFEEWNNVINYLEDYDLFDEYYESEAI